VPRIPSAPDAHVRPVRPSRHELFVLACRRGKPADAAMTQQVADHPSKLRFASSPADLLPWGVLTRPDQAFAHPQDVITAPDLSLEEKRAILASWASDAWAVESAPGLRHCPGLVDRIVPLDAVLDALRSLDPEETDQFRERPEPTRRARKTGVRWLTPRPSQAD
jgi:hypothetical protein